MAPPPAPPAPAPATAAAAPATGLGAIFKWDVAPPVKWSETLVLTIKQINAAAPIDDTITPYLMVYEADKSEWNDKGLGPDSKLEPILAIHGKFGADGKFSVTKCIPLGKIEHGCAVEVRLLGKDGQPIPLKDKDGADLAKLVMTLPGPDLDDGTWELDLSLRSSKDKERRQDRVAVQLPELPDILADPAKYVDDRFKDDGTLKNPNFVQSGARQSYDWLYVHCMSFPVGPPADWYKYEKLKSIFEGADTALGAHFIIGRDGSIFHTVPTFRACPHAGTVLRSGVKGNSNSIGIELAGLIDDLSVALLLCRALAKLAITPPAGLSGTLGAAAKAKLKAAAAFLCHPQKVGGNKSSGATVTARCNKMIDGLAAHAGDAHVKPVTDIFVPDDRDKWDNNGLHHYGDGRGIANRALQLLYAHALIGAAAGLELKAAKKDRVSVAAGVTKCTSATGCDMDSAGEGITLYRMAKDESLPGREAGGVRYATVPKAKVIAFCAAQLDEALDETHTRGAFRVFLDMSDADFNAFVGYTDAQYKSLADLTQAIHRVYQFKHVVTHHYAAQTRKRDPGVYFDWDRYLGDDLMTDVRAVKALAWDPADDNRKPKSFAERTHTGNWPA